MHYASQTTLVAFSLVPGTLGSFLNVQNDCDFPVFCMGTRSNDEIGEATKIFEVAEGDSWRSPLESMDVSISASLATPNKFNSRDDWRY